MKERLTDNQLQTSDNIKDDDVFFVVSHIVCVAVFTDRNHR